jgi:transcriptional regulator GlxA family with amidase domain
MLKYFIPIFLGTVLLASCGQDATKKTAPQAVKETAADSLLMSNLPDTVTNENHSALMDMILGKPKHNIKNIGILVYDGVNDLDMMGPRYVFGESGAKTRLIALKPGNIKTAMGVEIVPNTVIDSVNQLDILIIPGGFKGTIEAAYDKSLHEWIRKIDQSTTYTASVCTGGWILGATGLLQGKRASTNWYKEEDFLKKYGAIPANERYTQDGKYWTSAGVTAGMDMALAILKDNWGEKYAQAVMLDMEYDPAPPIEGGSPEKTGMLVRWMMKSMYDAGVNPIIDSLENKVK